MNIKNIFKSQEVLIKEIHDEFDTAQDRLLQEAKKILASKSLTHNEKIEQLAERLKSVGFSNTQIVREAEKIKDKRSKQQAHLDITREQAELIEYYKFNYPMLKFLTIEELDRICDKYGLMYAPTSAYIKNVPEKNLRDIEVAQPLKSEDATPMLIKYETSERYQGELNRLLKLLGKTNNVFTEKEQWDLLCKANLNPPKNWQLHIDPSMWTYVISIELLKTSRDIYDYNIETIDRSGLFIAAPKSHFELKGLKKKGKGFFNISVIEVKDPIVFRYVKGGVQVLTKWGLEAEDPMLVVDKMN